MIVDGRSIAKDIYAQIRNEISHLSCVPHMTVFTCAPNFETQKYLTLKKQKAMQCGIGISIIELPDILTTQEVMQSVQNACIQTNAIIVQLPLPDHIDAQAVLDVIPNTYDVDGMHYDGTSKTFLSPVVSAIAEISHRHDVLFAGRKVAVVGQGRLVGKPSAIWAQGQGASVKVITKDSPKGEFKNVIADADILILGAGVPGLITQDMIKKGVVIFDAGTSEDGGELRGDADASCAQKASLYTPVPGGIGPLTIAMLLRNVLQTVTH